MRLRFSSSPRLVEVSGPRADFSAWAQTLRQEKGVLPMDTGGGVIRCETLPTGKMEVSWSSSPKELRLRGGSEGMDILAESVEGFAEDGEIDVPWHLEYFKGHAYLAPASITVACLLVD
jgi:hypothetical protein